MRFLVSHRRRRGVRQQAKQSPRARLGFYTAYALLLDVHQSPLYSSGQDSRLVMGFLMEFAEHWIRRSMEDPDERDAKFRKHVQTTKEQSLKLKETWANPVKPYGSWNTDKNNHKFLQDLTLSRMPGRNDPYEALSSAASRS